MNETHHIFLGQNGEPYEFTRHTLRGPFPNTGGICIYAYRHPRGHLAGFQVHVLAIRQTDNLDHFLATDDRTCVVRECCNTIYSMECEDPKTCAAIVKDLKGSHPTLC